MPTVGTGRENTTAQPKRKVRKPKAKPKVTVVAPADRVSDRVAARRKQLKVSTRKAGDAPQDRAADTKRAETFKKTDKYVKTVKKFQAPLKPYTVYKVRKGEPRAGSEAELRQTLTTGKRPRRVEAPKLNRMQTVTAAPALKVLEQTTRPLHAIANATDAALHGGRVGTIGTGPSSSSILKAAGRGLQNKDKTTFSDVIKHAGVKNKKVAGAAGLVLDIGLDPTTYLTVGSGSVAAKAGEKAATKATKKALKAELSKEQAARMGERARKQAETGPRQRTKPLSAAEFQREQDKVNRGWKPPKRPDQTKGAVIKFAGHEVPGVRKATAKASKPVRRAVRKIVPQKVRDNSRAVLADVNPDVAPAGVSTETSRRAVQATRTARAKTNRGTHEAQQHALGIKQRVGEANYSRVIDAIEAGKIGSLPVELRDAAVRVRSQFRHANRQRKQAGIRGGEVGRVKGKTQGNVKGYIPHHLTEEAQAAAEKNAGGSGRKVIRPSSSQGRSAGRQAPLAELRQKFPGEYSEDLPNLYAGRKAEAATSVARAELNRRIADLGTDVKKGLDVGLRKGESVYHIVGSDIRKVPEKEVTQVIDHGGKKGRYVVLHDDIVKRAIEGSQPTLQGPGIIRGTDKVTAGFKRIALATPGFHVRNLVGDTQNAYLGQGGHRLAKNMVDAGRILKAEGRRDKTLRTLQPGTTKGGTLKTGRYGNVTYDDVAEQLSKHGAMRSGYTARELPELAGTKTTLSRVRLPRKAKQALLNREDLPRLTTAVDALKKGASWEDAAQRVSDYHFDYAHLTSFERNVARRVAPFYTFSARNIPLQAKSLITKPGKFANYEKLREEAAKVSGMDEENQKARDLTSQLKKAGVKLPDGWEANLSEWESRNVGVPVSWKGHKFTVSMGMPLVDLNELPGAALKNQLDEYYQKGMSLTGPIPKNLIEYMENHSFFFRDDIERDNAPLVAAPAWVKGLPAGLKKKMGVTDQWIDKKTGKKALAYRAKTDYIIKSIPGTPAFLNKVATDGHDRVGKGTVGKIMSYAGVKATPYDPVANAVNVAYDRLQEIAKEKAILNQQGVNAKKPTKAYQKLMLQEAALNSIAYQARKQQGYKVLPTVGGPKKYKVRKGSGFDFGGGSQSFDFSGGSSDFDFG